MSARATTCPSCGERRPTGARFCAGCGASLAPRCGSCDAELPNGARFCPACGERVPGADEAAEMLKLVTILFADVVESTARAEAAHPEDTRALLADYFDAMATEIRSEGGTVEKFIGDAIMAVFGVPTAREDDAIRAVRAGQAMLGRLRQWNAGRGAALQMRIGINTGFVVAAGSAGRDLIVTGDSVNVAARLEGAAAPGTILVGERTAQAVRGAFELSELEPLTLKGKSTAVRAWVAGEPLEADPAGEPGLEAPLVGRDSDLELLRMLLARVIRERSPQLVTIFGDPGVGKTRLVREFARSREAEIVVGRCRAYGDGAALSPLADIVRSCGGVLGTDAPEVAIDKLRTLVVETLRPHVSADPARVVSVLASTIGLDTEEERAADRERDPAQLRREFVPMWRTFLAELAWKWPLLVVIEDLHWAEDSLLETLQLLVSTIEAPLLFVTTARTDLLHARPDWGGGLLNYSAVPLSPLPKAESEELLAHLIDRDEVAIADAVLAKAEGNPFFIGEIVRRLVDEGRLAVRDGRLRPTGELTDVDLPDTVQAVIQARVDLLRPIEKRVLQHAAVAGRTFWPGALDSSVETDGVREVLRELERRGLVVERPSSSMEGEAEYVFKHVLIHEVAYASLPRRDRARAHERIAAWLEKVSGGSVESIADALAHHYRVAYEIAQDEGLRVAARRYSLAAAGTALRRFATQPAETFGWLAVDLSRPGGERVDALEALGGLYSLTLRADAAWRAYADALKEATASDDGDPDVVARLAASAAYIFVQRSQSMNAPPSLEEFRSVVDAGLAAAGEGDGRQRATLLAASAFGSIWFGDDARGDATRFAEDATAIAERLDDPELISWTIDAATLHHQEHGRYDAIYQSNLRRLELVPRLTNATEVSDAHAVAAWSSAITGRYRRAVEHATACVESARGRDVGEYVHGLVWRVWARFRLGEWDAVLDDQSEIERHEGSELPPFALTAYATALYCHELRGARAEADRYLERLAADVLRDANFGTGAAIVARALTHRGDLDTAAELLASVRGRHAVFAHEAECELAAASADWDAAARAAAVARAVGGRGGLLTFAATADRVDGQCAAAAGDVEEAAAWLRSSAETFGALELPWEAGRSRLLLGELLLERDPRDGQTELATALRLFERLDAVAEAARAREALHAAKA